MLFEKSREVEDQTLMAGSWGGRDVEHSFPHFVEALGASATALGEPVRRHIEDHGAHGDTPEE